MKKILIIALIIMSIVGCASFDAAVQNVTNSINELGEASVEMAILSPMLEFSIFYASYFFLGGYGFGDENFKNGEGVTWNVVTNNGEEEITVTRALLKRVDNGAAWWSISATVDGEDRTYEMLLEDDYDILKIRYINSETGLVEEIIPEQSEESGEGTGSEDEIETMGPEFYAQYSVGEEKVKTKAGSFKADHIVFEDKDVEQGYHIKYEYWLSDRVPGFSVKYIYANISDNETISGEVIDIRGGYKTQMKSY